MVTRVLVFVVGFGLVAWTIVSAIRTVILPRSAQSTITRTVFRVVRIPFRWFASERRDYAERDRVMAMFAPIALVTLAGVWLALITFGYGLMFWGVDGGAVGGGFDLSGSSITTLGIADAETAFEQFLAVTEAGWGLFIITLLITYLPSMYGAFQRRETEVALLEVRAGNPPSAVEFIIRHHTIGWLGDVDDTMFRWERWFAELDESHTSYAALPFFRSPQPSRSWVTAAGTMLDTASLMAAAVRGGRVGPKGITVRAGYVALRNIADFFGLEYDPDPAPTDPISITRSEFEDALDRLDEAGVPLVEDRDRAWADFAGWRVNYDVVLLALAEITLAPYAPWTSDRSGPQHTRPRIGRFGGRLSSRRR
jgi:hypothetical protein